MKQWGLVAVLCGGMCGGEVGVCMSPESFISKSWLGVGVCGVTVAVVIQGILQREGWVLDLIERHPSSVEKALSEELQHVKDLQAFMERLPVRSGDAASWAYVWEQCRKWKSAAEASSKSPLTPWRGISAKALQKLLEKMRKTFKKPGEQSSISLILNEWKFSLEEVLIQQALQSLPGLLPEKERQAFQIRLWNRWKWRTALYGSGDLCLILAAATFASRQKNTLASVLVRCALTSSLGWMYGEACRQSRKVCVLTAILTLFGVEGLCWWSRRKGRKRMRQALSFARPVQPPPPQGPGGWENNLKGKKLFA